MKELSRRTLLLGSSAVLFSGAFSACREVNQDEISKTLSLKASIERLRDGVIKLDYILDGQEYQIILYKQSNNSFKVRINKYMFISEIGRKDWKRIKSEQDNVPGLHTSIVSYTNERHFGLELGHILDEYIGRNRKKIPDLNDEIYKLLSESEIPETQDSSEGKVDSSNTVSSYGEKPIHLGYKEKYKDKKIQGVTKAFGDRNAMKGRILRCLRWKDITEAVEERYGIPNGLLLAMMAQEGYGDPTLPNLGGDGGLGLIHIQAVNAYDYGLKTLKRSTRSMRDLSHGRKIKEVLEKEDYDLRKLIKYDDRFHPIMAVDVAARFLMDKKRQVERRGLSKKDKKNIWIFTLKRYSGRGLKDYALPVLKYWYAINKISGYTMPDFNSDIRYTKANTTIAKIEESMESMTLRIGRKSSSYQDYLDYNAKQNQNYGLDQYKNIGKYPNK